MVGKDFSVDGSGLKVALLQRDPNCAICFLMVFRFGVCTFAGGLFIFVV